MLINIIKKEIKQDFELEKIKSEVTLIEIFPFHNRLCSIFPTVKMPFKSVNNVYLYLYI